MLIIVSGCPRSGTSLTIQILEKAGMEIAHDKQRKPDEYNVHGYFEVEHIIDRIKENPELIKQFDGQVLKIINYGLKFLPEADYKVLYVKRNLEEVVGSMATMIKGEFDKEKTIKAFEKLEREVQELLNERDDMDVLYVSHRELLTKPESEIDRIIDFLKIDPSKKKDMVAAIDPSSYRVRVT